MVITQGDKSHELCPIARLPRAPGRSGRDDGRSVTTAAAATIPAGGTVVLHHILTVGNGDAGTNHAEVKGGDTGQSSAGDGTVQVSEP